jgi:hypothetical protein
MAFFKKSATFNMPDTNSLIVNTSMQDISFAAKPGKFLFKGILSVFFLAAILSFFVLPVTAHAPSNITIGYNPDMHKLSVTITHPVDDPKTHYIRGVQVKINGEVISDPAYKSQPGRNSFTYTYDVMANPEDAVWVIATCVNGQSLEEHYSVPRPVTPTAAVRTLPPVTTSLPPATTALPTTATTYADTGLLPLFGAAAVLLIIRK